MKRNICFIIVFMVCSTIFAITPKVKNTTYFTQIGVGKFTAFETLTVPEVEVGLFDKNLGFFTNFKFGFDNINKNISEELYFIGIGCKYKTDFDKFYMSANIGVGPCLYKTSNTKTKSYFSEKIENMYIIPNFGISMYLNICKHVDIWFEPTFNYFISIDNLDDKNFTTWNLSGGIKIKF